MKDITKYAPWLLLLSGLLLFVPRIYGWLTNLTGGTPYIQIVIGALSVIVALLILKK